MHAYLLEFGNMLLRWLHVIAAMAWIGESFLFVMLDTGLRKPADAADRKRGVFGEMWAVHGGGFYHHQKYTAAPPKLPEHLHWSFLKAYTTWLSGFALFALLYLVRPDLYLANHDSDWGWVRQLSGWQIDLAAVLFLVLGWVVYNELCKRISPRAERDGVLALAVAVMMIGVAWLSMQIFSGRAAFLLTGAVMGTAMAGNVLFWIIPGQRRMVAAMEAGEEPDPDDGKRGKQRSVHNTYFTLPVVLLMLSNHYAFMYAHAQAWLLMVLLMFAGALIRQFFVLMHGGAIRPLYPVIGSLLIAGALWLAWPANTGPAPAATGAADSGRQINGPVTLARVQQVLERRCVECHSRHPTEAGFTAAPAGILLDDRENVMRLQTRIKQAVASRYMPLGNLTGMTDAERALIAAWQPVPGAAQESASPGQ